MHIIFIVGKNPNQTKTKAKENEKTFGSQGKGSIQTGSLFPIAPVFSHDIPTYLTLPFGPLRRPQPHPRL